MIQGPLQEEIEVSIFGRGYGEAVAIHYGDGNWVLIDSLIDSNGISAPLSYLDSINVKRDQIKVVLATHWHDDHVRGLAQIYEEANQAEFFFSAALVDDEWKAFNQRQRVTGGSRISSGLSELRRIAEAQEAQHRPVLRYATINRSILRVGADDLSHKVSVDFEALAPCDADIAAFHQMLADTPAAVSRVMPFHRNDVSVPIWLRIGNHRILLGADLEVVQDLDRGWNAVLNSLATLDGEADLVKVSHHGSENGHHPDLWEHHVKPNPIAILSPWNRGSKLPSERDVTRIIARAPRAFSSSRLDKKAQKRAAVVERTLKEAGQKIRSKPLEVGQVRVRFRPDESPAEWQLELLNGAVQLQQLYYLADA